MKKTFFIDHGNRLIKSMNFAFPASYVESSHLLTIGGDILTYGGKEYALYDHLLPQLNDKTEDERYFILTLFTIGKEIAREEELHRIRLLPNEAIEATLVIGLPPQHCKSLGPSYVDYFMANGRFSFELNEKQYIVHIVDVFYYPQAYAAALTIRDQLKDARTLNIIDIGGFTCDCLTLTHFTPSPTGTKTLYWGVNELFREINERIRAMGKYDIPVDEIESILRNDPKALEEASPKRVELIRDQAISFAERMLLEVKSAGYDIEEYKTVFVGGGSILLKEQILRANKVEFPFFASDIFANVRGYKMMYEQELKSKLVPGVAGETPGPDQPGAPASNPIL